MTREPQNPDVTIRRADRPGDLGWVLMAHGEIYHEQFGWNAEFEAMVARIVADYAEAHDPAREAAWIAEVDGERAGCVLLVAGEIPEVARLRVLLVTPRARGLGLGTRLVQECVDLARTAGYRRITLFTTGNLASAHRIYEAAGFVVVDEEQRHSFGHDLVGQNWTLDLDSNSAVNVGA
ncbi:GNAT family N-acetyltransferase [Myceligenerans pegani]|uniref:GNAT family N-acetyltransferase n=1 Tax=Myceligenerans pegani TaxID=2776917 RepID=A0ABR9N5B6_9MICO|nr:GNAT family N-acetyltransferase [Myceligenerans sp. TRM 65318]MBE1878182.1 GNAT family N-acetyltransferase [Myceligenerans sp. TRM 65318]MBE3020453.1 GNAT family N-acetyltransferase [Myceligenerans sp. TRM 65318]